VTEMNIKTLLPIRRPEPVQGDLEVTAVKKVTDPQWAAQELLAGEYLLVLDFFSTGLTLLSALKQLLQQKHQDTSFQGERALRSTFQAASQRLLAPIENNTLALRKAPQIGWLQELYPDQADFLLPFPQVQGLNSSWQWFQKGILFPVLSKPVHPFYGTYFPTRFEHLELFGDWLETFQGKRESALDIGTGCGVLALHMLEQGFKQVFATDINPNAVESVRRHAESHGLEPALELEHADLLGSFEGQADLIVFNPPWLPAIPHSDLDKAMYFEPDLFERFFAQAYEALAFDGRLVLIFSTLITQTGGGKLHPIEAALQPGGAFELVAKHERGVRAGSRKTRRSKQTRKNEKVEVWELMKRSS
jgi:hypothetical protein